MYAYVLVNGSITEVWFSLERAVARHLALPGSSLVKTIINRETSPAEYLALQAALERGVVEVAVA